MVYVGIISDIYGELFTRYWHC